MFITTYLINNVLRVYGDLLRQGRVAVRQKNTDDGLSDKISISTKARRKTIVDNITANIVNKIIRYGPHDNVEKEVFENEYGAHLAISGEDSDGLIFKEIDENGETINSLSIEDSNLLTKKLIEITEETIDKNMKQKDEVMKIDNRIINYEIAKQLPKKAKNKIEGMGVQKASNDPKIEEKNQSQQDTIVNLSTASKEVQTAMEIIASEPDVREDKVAELKKRIESGNYTVDNKAVADKIVDSFIDEIL